LNNKPAGKKLAVMAAGAAFNLISMSVVMVLVFAFQTGYTTLEVGRILPNIPGSQANEILEVGDTIVALDGKKVWNYKDFSFLMSNNQSGEKVELTIKRDGVKRNVEITPVNYERRYILGIEMKTEDMTLTDAPPPILALSPAVDIAVMDGQHLPLMRFGTHCSLTAKQTEDSISLADCL